MTGVDEILNYQRNPDDDYYALLGCDENSSVSEAFCYFSKNKSKLHSVNRGKALISKNFIDYIAQ